MTEYVKNPERARELFERDWADVVKKDPERYGSMGELLPLLKAVAENSYLLGWHARGQEDKDV